MLKKKDKNLIRFSSGTFIFSEDEASYHHGTAQPVWHTIILGCKPLEPGQNN